MKRLTLPLLVLALAVMACGIESGPRWVIAMEPDKKVALHVVSATSLPVHKIEASLYCLKHVCATRP